MNYEPRPVHRDSRRGARHVAGMRSTAVHVRAFRPSSRHAAHRSRLPSCRTRRLRAVVRARGQCLGRRRGGSRAAWILSSRRDTNAAQPRNMAAAAGSHERRGRVRRADGRGRRLPDPDGANAPRRLRLAYIGLRAAGMACRCRCARGDPTFFPELHEFSLESDTSPRWCPHRRTLHYCVRSIPMAALWQPALAQRDGGGDRRSAIVACRLASVRRQASRNGDTVDALDRAPARRPDDAHQESGRGAIPVRRTASVAAAVGLAFAFGSPFVLGGTTVLASLRGVAPQLILILAGLATVSGVAKAGKLHVLLVNLNQRPMFLRILAISLATDFAFLSSPAGAAGYVVNMALLRTSGTSWVDATAVVGAEQVLDLFFFAVAMPVAAISGLGPLAQIAPKFSESAYVALLTVALFGSGGLWYSRHRIISTLHSF